jgi:phospholipid/cholesterol/gamma-HCH transport system ATP-binding protein
LIRTLREALGLTTIIVSHDVPETLHIADYIYLIANRQIIAQGSPDDLRQSDSPFVQQFLNGSPDGPVRFHYPAKSYIDELGAAV